MDKPRWLSADEQRMWRSFQAMQRQLFRALERDLAENSGLSAADFAVLVPLSEAPERQLRARDLGQHLDWDRSRLSHQVRRMEQRGLLVRRDCPTDARGTVVELTADGWTAIERAAPDHVEAVRLNLFDLLTEADVAFLQDIAERVTTALSVTEPVRTCGEERRG